MLIHRAAALCFVASLLVCCQSTPPAASPGEVVAPPTQAARPPPTPIASGATGTLTCPWVAPGSANARVTYDRSCERDDDCAWAAAPTCCGAIHALGVREGDETRITGGCGACPAVACPVGPTVAEDGAAVDPPKSRDVAVSCVRHVCTTAVRP